MMKVIVFGNATLDVICFPINEVPRRDSIAFDDVSVSPGGCGSNVAIGLSSLGIPTGIITQTGDDDAAEMLFRYWERVGIDTRHVSRNPGLSTGTSIGLIDTEFQPRFIHTPGANRMITAEAINPQILAELGVEFFHIAGFFVLPKLFEDLAVKLSELRRLGVTTSLDVVFNVRMDDPDLRQVLWTALPHLDIFMANEFETARLLGEPSYEKAAMILKNKGADKVIVKRGEEGCFGISDTFTGSVPTRKVNVVDTTGAGDAFAAGFVAALIRGKNFQEACQAGNEAGALICTQLGAINAWMRA
jgi:sugar/nucleoside kinase (ribokinase family)